MGTGTNNTGKLLFYVRVNISVMPEILKWLPLMKIDPNLKCSTYSSKRRKSNKVKHPVYKKSTILEPLSKLRYQIGIVTHLEWCPVGLGIEYRTSIGTGWNIPVLMELFKLFTFIFLTERKKKRQSSVYHWYVAMETVQLHSKVWLQFTKINDTSVKYATCKTIISCKGGCTTNMTKHLRDHDVE